jgi:LDH2 family malate/lactate/ureidoglycolate dehydrogenase
MGSDREGRMSQSATITIKQNLLHDFLVRIFRAAGCSDENAELCAKGAVDADLHGHHIQGTDHIYSTVRELRAGRLNGQAKAEITHQTAAAARMDGDGGPGHVTGMIAARLAIKKATEAGIGAVALIGGGDIFRLGYYAETIADAGMVGIIFTNTHPMRVHPTGGIDPLLGTNPIAFGFPVSGAKPIIVDLATSNSAIGHVRLASYTGAPIPPGIAIDREGNPTTDARQALDGALTPLGGHKGFALGLAVGLLSGPVIGAVLGERLKEALAEGKGERKRGHLFVAIDPRAFGVGDNAARTAEYAAELKASRRSKGTTEIVMPGERGHRKKTDYQRHGIPLPKSVWDNTVKIANDLGVAPPKLS